MSETSPANETNVDSSESSRCYDAKNAAALSDRLLKEQYCILSDELHKRNRQKGFTEWRSKIGRCYKKDNWFVKVVSASNDGTPIVVIIDMTKEYVAIDRRSIYIDHQDWSEISKADWNQKVIESQDQVRKTLSS